MAHTARTELFVANPYVVGRPLTGASANLYFGREEVFAWLTENLSAAAQPNALLLYGRRRIGKTSTLYQMMEGERGRALRHDPTRPLAAAYIDLQRLAGRPTDEWLRLLARDICHRVGTSGLERVAPDSSFPGETAYAAFDRCLDRLEHTTPDNSLILVALDEFEQIQSGMAAGTLDAAVLPFLRSQIQHRRRVAFLISGAHGLLDPFWRPITDLTARFELGPLTASQAEALIRQPVAGALAYDDASVEAIWQTTGGHPFHIQTLCHRLVSRMNRRGQDTIAADDVATVVEQLAAEGVWEPVMEATR